MITEITKLVNFPVELPDNPETLSEELYGSSTSNSPILNTLASQLGVKLGKGKLDNGYNIYDDTINLTPAYSQERRDLVLLHELAHASGSKHRLGRFPYKKYNSIFMSPDEKYQEEVLAECVAVILYQRHIRELSAEEYYFSAQYVQLYAEWVPEIPELQIMLAVNFLEAELRDGLTYPSICP